MKITGAQGVPNEQLDRQPWGSSEFLVLARRLFGPSAARRK